METVCETARSPQLQTVVMVEEYVRKHDGEYSRKQIWERLPRKMMYQTFRVIIEYLLYSRKISVDKEGKIGWIFYPDSDSGVFWRRYATR